MTLIRFDTDGNANSVDLMLEIAGLQDQVQKLMYYYTSSNMRTILGLLRTEIEGLRKSGPIHPPCPRCKHERINGACACSGHGGG